MYLLTDLETCKTMIVRRKMINKSAIPVWNSTLLSVDWASKQNTSKDADLNKIDRCGLTCMCGGGM